MSNKFFIECGFIADAFRAFENDWFQHDNPHRHIANLTKATP
jgi:hypothetical protein